MNVDCFPLYLAIRQVLSWALVTTCISLVLILPNAGIEHSTRESYIAVNGRKGWGTGTTFKMYFYFG